MTLAARIFNIKMGFVKAHGLTCLMRGKLLLVSVHESGGHVVGGLLGIPHTTQKLSDQDV